VVDRFRVISTPVARESHAVLDAGKLAFFTRIDRFAAGTVPELQRDLVLAESLACARKIGEDFLAGNLGDAFLVEMLERSGEIVCRFTIRVFLERRSTGGAQISHRFARECL
jgi:hypothetical protein